MPKNTSAKNQRGGSELLPSNLAAYKAYHVHPCTSAQGCIAGPLNRRVCVAATSSESIERV